MKYQVVIEYDPSSKHYTATVAGVPSIVVDAKSENSALRMAREAIELMRSEASQHHRRGLAAVRPTVRTKIVTLDV